MSDDKNQETSVLDTDKSKLKLVDLPLPNESEVEIVLKREVDNIAVAPSRVNPIFAAAFSDPMNVDMEGDVDQEVLAGALQALESEQGFADELVLDPEEEEPENALTDEDGSGGESEGGSDSDNESAAEIAAAAENGDSNVFDDIEPEQPTPEDVGGAQENKSLEAVGNAAGLAAGLAVGSLGGFLGAFSSVKQGVISAGKKLQASPPEFDETVFNKALAGVDNKILAVTEIAESLATGPLSELKDNPGLIKKFDNPEVNNGIKTYKKYVKDLEKELSSAIKKSRKIGSEEGMSDAIKERMIDVERNVSEKLEGFTDQKGNSLTEFLSSAIDRVVKTIEQLINFVRGKGMKTNEDLVGASAPAMGPS